MAPFSDGSLHYPDSASGRLSRKLLAFYNEAITRLGEADSRLIKSRMERRRAWSVGRPCHRLALVPALRPGVAAAFTPAPQADER
jgi:hypothetical protein